MKNRMTPITIAMAVALAVAVLSGPMYPSNNVAHAANPVFDLTPAPGTRSVAENTPPGVNIGAPISATDPDETGDDAIEFGNTLTYSLGGTDASSFDIDSSTGQLITKAPLDFETEISYSVTVTVDDGEDRNSPIEQTVVISVSDINEPPAAPFAPTVVSGDDDTNTEADESTTTLKVVWHAPDNLGDDITGYEVEYKRITETAFGTANVNQTALETLATITGLEADTSYQVRVRATSAESVDSQSTEIAPWSFSGTGSTNRAGNAEPSFDESGVGAEQVLTRTVDENERSGEDIGHEVRANANVDDNRLTYEIGGPDADLFDFNAASGQIRTKVSLNHEDPQCYVETAPPDPNATTCYYYVTVAVFDGAGGSDARPVRIEVRDRSEHPDAPARPTVRATDKSSRSLDVSWNEPRNPGPAIISYQVRYRKGTSGAYTTIEGITDTSATIAPEDNESTSNVDERLSPGTSYEIHVRAITDEQNSVWSALSTGRTSTGNQDAIFDDRPDDEAAETARTIERTVDENTRAGQAVGRPVRARDRDKLTYKLVAADAPNAEDFGKFSINESTGQILTKEPLNHEDSGDSGCGYNASDPETTCTYTVKVEVRDGFDEHGNEEADNAPATETLDDVITVAIKVRDVAEPPAAPTLTVTSPAVAEDSSTATLSVTWDRPETPGLDITGYVVECTGAGITSSNPCPQPVSPSLSNAVVSYVITGLTPNSSYRVRVRAENDEGLGAWSSQKSQSTSKPGNVIPTITTDANLDLKVEENARSGSLAFDDQVSNDAVQGDDSDSTGALTYRIDGPYEDLFTIDASGQIKTRKSLDHEDPRCYSEGSPSECSYSLRVKVADRDNGSNSITLMVKVTDLAEPPSAPATPTVTATPDTGKSLEVSWNEPTNTGPAIVGYQIAYREYSQGTNTNPYTIVNHDSTERMITITTIGDESASDRLEPRTQYEVRVRARNGEGEVAQGETNPWGNWSQHRRASTGASNVRPIFAISASLITLELAENTRAGQNVGSAIEATDGDRGNRLVYSVDGPGAASFDINSGTGQIRTRSGVTYDFESQNRYSVTVKVDDGQRKANSVAAKSVTIEIEDRDEPPSTPTAPRVTGIAGSTDSVRVTWEEPANTGPAIDDYDVQCPDCPLGISHDGVDRSMIITGLTPGRRYNLQVRAWNAEGHSDWSRPGSGSPNADVSNQRPIFSGGTRTFTIAENTVVAGDPIGSPVTAVDPDLDTVTHTLEGTDATSFTIDAGSGQIRATGELDHEEKSSYSVTVKATDTRGGSATVGVTIRVTDAAEPPDTPLVPTVTGASSTSLQVTWDAPGNDGPPIVDYDYRYRQPLGIWTEVTNTTINETTVTIQGLAASTSYDVEVRARNAEGTSEWSNSGYGSTTAADANSPPVFSEGSRTTRSVHANASAGTPVGHPVTATDSDQGATLTYSLEGADSASFNVNDRTGQILTSAGITLTVATTYDVTIVASDGTDSSRIPVTITATSAPPNIPPVFSEGASATRSVARSARAGTAIGQRVAATDADASDTLTYSLEGADAASFEINRSTGQLLTRAGVTLVRASYAVTVVATDNGAARAQIAVTISATNSAPVFSSASTTRSVARSATAGTPIGVPVTATDADTGDTLTYTLEGTDAASFRINSSTGQLLTQAALFESSYTVTVVATDQANESARINVTINVANRAPQFSETSTTRTVDRNALVGTAIGAPVTATDSDPGDLLAYRLAGTDAASFRINSSTGQLLTRAGVALDVASYSVTVIATDQANETASIGVTINVANSAPVFSDTTTTRSVERGAPVGAAIGDPVTATDADLGDTLAYSLAGTDRASFRINGSTGQLITRAGVTLDAASYSVTIVATDELTASASISVTITVANAAPAFSDTSTSRTVGWTATENTPIGNPVTATDSDPGDTLDYSLSGADAASFGIDSSTGQLLTRAGVTLDSASYSITVVATDGLGATASIAVAITAANATPAFSDTTATRTVDRNAAENTPIGNPVTATDSDPGDTLDYSLSGADAASFGIDSSTGQLLTRAGVTLNSASYSITVVATDGLGATASIAVTITVANAAPAFSDTTATRTVGWTATENTPIGNPVTATDSDRGDTLDYSLSGADAASFGIDSSTGQLLTRAGVTLNSASYSITVVATDGLGATASIAVTITVANAAPAFSDTTATRTVDRNAAENTPIGNPVTATDSDPGDTLVYSLSGADAASLGIDSSTGQLLTRAGVSFDRASYSITVVATDGLGATASIAVTITVANAAPAFSDTTATRTLDRDAAENTPIGNPVTATDSDPGDTLAYSLSGADAASLGIDSSTGQLLTRTGVSFDRASYSITVVATDGLGATASIAVTITVANAAPAFSDTTATRTVDRDAPADTNIGAPITAMDADTGDTLTYSLGGDDDASFHIDSSDGQLLTPEGVSLDEDSYAVMVIATDGLGATATISVTITVTDGDGLLGRFDTDEDGSISQDEVFEAILEFLSGQANSDEILGIILLFITQ